jgi:serpin B
MGDQEEPRPSKKPRASAGSGALTAFALRLAKKLAEGDGTKDGNIAFSPLSIYTALGLVAAGARGKTLDELLALLGAASPDEIAEYVRRLAEQCKPAGSGSGSGTGAGPLVTMACGVFHQQRMDIKPAYRHTAAEDYNAEIRAVNFAKVSSHSTNKALSSRRSSYLAIVSLAIPCIVSCVQGDREKIREEINGWAAAATSDLIPDGEILAEHAHRRA